VMYPSSSRWTDEGALFAWHMKLVERVGWLTLRVQVVSSDATALEQAPPMHNGSWTLVPETDTALYPDQAGEVVTNPGVLLHYARHLRGLFAARGVEVAVFASSCVAVNGRAAQPLFAPDVDLLRHADRYHSLAAGLRGESGVGSFLTRWRPLEPSDACPLRRPQGAASDEEALAMQRQSDATYAWLYAPLFGRERLSAWQWEGRSRLPTALAAWRRGTQPANDADCAAGEGEASPASPPAPPPWASRCSYLHASEAVWCPSEASPA